MDLWFDSHGGHSLFQGNDQGAVHLIALRCYFHSLILKQLFDLELIRFFSNLRQPLLYELDDVSTFPSHKNHSEIFLAKMALIDHEYLANKSVSPAAPRLFR
jgi:hypothetical protein